MKPKIKLLHISATPYGQIEVSEYTMEREYTQVYTYHDRYGVKHRVDKAVIEHAHDYGVWTTNLVKGLKTLRETLLADYNQLSRKRSNVDKAIVNIDNNKFTMIYN